ncbi:DUF397 domain-containing protein [Sphaerisporangium fuscum]|uniref:DUF397 domain-containing protein n=1 Tax=Sphaerisporangium fuscum TaxID=2835868 RepID=UPI001BDD05C0|nr:DUF397 domain-containing protein [Sphaerisporangium fuscum]
MSYREENVGRLTWRKSSFSEGANGCIELAVTGVIPSGSLNGAEIRYLVRDSKSLGGPVLAFPRQEWRAFVDGIKAGRFHL